MATRKNHSDTSDEEFERYKERKTSRNSSINEVAEQISAIREQRTTLTQEKKNKSLEKWEKAETHNLPVYVKSVKPVAYAASDMFEKATDDDLRNASKFITESNLSKLATRYLALTSQQTEGRNVFDVLKLWRDAMPYQGSKQVRVETRQFF